jgi:hypothetical protein
LEERTLKLVGEKCLGHFARESTLEAVLQRRGDGVAKGDQVPLRPPYKIMKKRPHLHYIAIAFGTVLFWRGTWNLIDRIPGISDTFLFDIATAVIGLIMLYALTKSFKHLD